MADFSILGGGQRFEVAGAVDSAASRGTIITSGTNNVKGSYVELIASTSYSASAFLWCILGSGGLDKDFLVDLAIGAGGSEVDLVSNFLFTTAVNPLSTYGMTVWPVPVPAGSRVSARVQSTVGVTGTVRTVVQLIAAGGTPSSPLSLVTSYGPNTADSGAVSVDPGGTANTEGAWSEITSSTSHPIRELVIALGKQVNASLTAGSMLIDIGIGGAGSEQVLISNLPAAFVLGNTPNICNQLSPVCYPSIPVSIPAGTRIAARAQSTITDTTDRLFDVALYGIS